MRRHVNRNFRNKELNAGDMIDSLTGKMSSETPYPAKAKFAKKKKQIGHMRLSSCLGVCIRCIILPLREQRRGIKSAGQDKEVAVTDVLRERLIS